MKQTPGVKNPALLQQLHDLWGGFGCAFCGRQSESPELGYYVELHHLKESGFRDDTIEGIVGACGVFLNGCHQDVTEHRTKVQRNDGGVLVWRSTSPGAHFWRELRLPEAEMYEAFGATVLPGNGHAEPAAADGELLHGEVVPARRHDDAPAGTPADGALAPHERRAQHLRLLVVRSEQDRLAAAILLAKAFEAREYELLGQSWPEYYQAAGLDKSQVSKMLKVAQVFRGAWLELPAADQQQLSIERLYVSAQRVTRDEVGHSTALHDAVANPTHQLVAMRTGDEPAEKCHCRCPKCGAEVTHSKADG